MIGSQGDGKMKVLGYLVNDHFTSARKLSTTPFPVSADPLPP
jgi:hypothetical protein